MRKNPKNIQKNLLFYNTSGAPDKYSESVGGLQSK